MFQNPLRTLGLALVVPLLIGAIGCGPDQGEDEPEADAFQEERPTPAEEQAPTASESESAERTERRTAERRTVPTGTVMTLSLNETVSTNSHEVGDEFATEVTQSVRGEDGTTLIPEGAEVRGVVEESRRSAGPEDQAIIAFRLESLELEGDRYPLEATVQQARPERSEGDSGAETAAKIAIGTAAGALIGQVLGEDTESTLGGAAAGAVAGTVVALTSRQGDATLHEGSRLRIQLNEPIQLERSGG